MELGACVASRDLSTEDADAVREMKDLSRDVLGLLERRRRREVELTALFQSAIDLAAIRDLDGVLEAIVRRTRLLLHADVAYMSLIDEGSDDTHLRVTCGVVSPTFQQLRMQIGDSLGGLVLQTGMPASTRNYFDETRIAHVAAVDAAVADEGLVAILGVPLLLGTRVIGVLYAAHRTERTFSADEIAVASSLGAHAAVACDNARLFQSMHTALAALNDANETIRQRSDLISTAAEVHLRLTQLLAHGSDLAVLAETLSRALGGTPLAIVDRRGTTMVVAGGWSQEVESKIHEGMRRARREGQAVRVDGYCLVSVRTSQEDFGAIVAESDGDLDELGLRVLEHAALVMALLLTMRTVVAETEKRLRRDLVDDLLSTNGDNTEALVRRAIALGVDLERPYVVAVAVGERSADLTIAASTWASSRGESLVGKHQGHTVLLIAGTDASSAAQMVATEVARFAGQKVTAASAGPGHGVVQLRRAFQEAQRSLAVMIRMGAVGVGSTAARLGFAGLMLAERPDPQAFVRTTIGAVLDYDARRGSRLLHTLHVYLEHDRNVSGASRALQIHLNTMRQRLDRLTRLLGDDWQSARRLLEVQVALHLHSTLDAVRAGSEPGAP